MREDSTFSLYMSLLAVFVPFSLVAIGGGGSVFAPIQRESVDVQHWITGREFIELFAPHLTRRVIEAACERHGTGALDELFADMELPTY